MGRDIHERKHRRTAGHHDAVATMAGADFSAAESLSDAMGLRQPLTYVEGEMFTGSDPHKKTRACWLADDSDSVICVVTEGSPDFDHCRAALKQAANATKALPQLLAACEAMLPFLPDQNELLNYAATNDGSASRYDCAAVAIRKAVEAAKECV